MNMKMVIMVVTIALTSGIITAHAANQPTTKETKSCGSCSRPSCGGCR